MIEILALVVIMIALDRAVVWAGSRVGGNRIPRSLARLYNTNRDYSYRDDEFRPADPMVDFADDREGRIAPQFC